MDDDIMEYIKKYIRPTSPVPDETNQWLQDNQGAFTNGFGDKPMPRGESPGGGPRRLGVNAQNYERDYLHDYGTYEYPESFIDYLTNGPQRPGEIR